MTFADSQHFFALPLFGLPVLPPAIFGVKHIPVILEIEQPEAAQPSRTPTV
jgi:hypothetical protein